VSFIHDVLLQHVYSFLPCVIHNVLLQHVYSFLPCVIHYVLLQHVYPHIYLYENEETLTTCIKYMEDFTGVRVKDLKKRSFKVSYIRLILHVFSCCSTLSSDSVESCRWVAEFRKNLHLHCLWSRCVVWWCGPVMCAGCKEGNQLRGLSGKYPAILNISRTSHVTLM